MKTVWWVTTLFVSQLFCSNTHSFPITLQPDPIQGKDVWVYSKYPGNNYGTSTSLAAQNTSWSRHTFIEFDLSSLPTDITIASAVMQLHNWSTSGTPVIDAYKVTSSWTELGLKWSNQPTVESMTQIPFTTAPNNWFQWDITNFIEYWYNDPSNNYGVKLVNTSAGSQGFFHSSDTSSAAFRPKLIIEYTLVPEPATLFLFGLGLVGLVRKKLKNQ